MHPIQLPLGITLQDQARFDNFVAGPNATQIKALMDALSSEEFAYAYLWGARGVGKSHCLQAACSGSLGYGKTAAYIPLRQLTQPEPTLLQGLESLSLVCLDDIDLVGGKQEWEVPLFNLFNALKDSRACLLLSASKNVDQLGLSLADLVSRLKWGLNLRLQELSDSEKLQALALRCQQRGIELPADSSQYLLNHYQRQMNQLYELLEQLIQEAIQAKRRLTIPFIKEILEPLSKSL